jgi:threonine synthase
MSYFSHLECSVPCGAGPLDARARHHLCPSCGMPLLARYDLDTARQAWTRGSLADREPTMWRYREVMPLFDGESPVSLGEGWTPLLAAPRLGAALGLQHLYIKDESLNPTNSFKARGLSAAVTRAAHLGASTLSIPTAGNAGNAMAAYAARAGLAARVYMPRDAKSPFVRECELYGAHVTLVDGLITDAGRQAAEDGRAAGWYDVSTLKEPYRIEGKKTMGYELAEQLGWRLPGAIVYPTGGGTGMVGMWKAFDEMERLGWIGPERPKMFSVQAAGCAPIVRAWQRGDEHAEPWQDAHTYASGLRVPRAVGDFLILRAVRDSGGAAIAVDDDEMRRWTPLVGRLTGVFCAPEGAACAAAVPLLRRQGALRADESVVLFNTGSGLKYVS